MQNRFYSFRAIFLSRLNAKPQAEFTPRQTSVVRVITASILASLIQVTIASAQNCASQPASLVSWWRGEGNASDSIGSNHGTIYGGVTFTNGEVGAAFLLNGTDAFIQVSNSPSLNPATQITVEAWYKPVASSGASGNDPIVDKGYVSHSPPYYQYHLGVSHGTFTFWVANAGTGTACDGGSWTPDNWYHLAGTYDGSFVRLYVNGVLIDSQAASGNLSDYGRDLYIGRFSNSSFSTPGVVDEVSIYSRALASSEIAAIYSAGSFGKCASPPTNSPPTIFTQPQSQTNAVGSTVAFSVLTGGTAPLTYLWLSNSVPLSNGGRVMGANSNQITIGNLQLSDSGNYAVIVSNAFGSALSSNAILVVTTNLTWTGSVSTDWNNPNNWSPQQVPAASDHVIINSGTIIVPADGAFAVMDLTGGAIVGALTEVGGATVNWSGGAIVGALTVASNAVLNFTGSSEKDIACALTNAGTVVWAGSGVVYVPNGLNSNNGLIENLAGGVWDIQSDASLLPYYSGNWYFRNAGTVLKSAGSGTTSIGIPFYNTGTVGAWEGTLSFQGGYSNNPSANLAISLGGPAVGNGYGKISFSTPLSFDGTFTVGTRNGYLPNPGATFQVLDYPSSTNSFTCLSGLDLGGGILLQPQFGPTSLTLLATAYTPNASQPQLFINRTLGGHAITWPVGFPGWTLQSTTNLSSAAWTTVSNACGNQMVVPMIPQQYFRLHNGN